MSLMFERNSNIRGARALRERSEDSSLHSTIVADESDRITKLIEEEKTLAYDFNMTQCVAGAALQFGYQAIQRELVDA